jgi:phospholipase C
MHTLTGVSINFNTHEDEKDDTTIVHVFVKNRSYTSASPDNHADFIANLLDEQRYEPNGDLLDLVDTPYLAFGIGLGAGDSFGAGTQSSFDLSLGAFDINADEIVLPAVSIHILTDGDDQWTFDYALTFTFVDETGTTDSFSLSSVRDGITGVTLNQNCRDYHGILAESKLLTSPPPRDVPETDAVLDRVTIEFATHHDNKNADTRLDIHVVNRLSATAVQDIAVGLDLFAGEEFPDAGAKSPLSVKKYSWSSSPPDGALASDAIRLADIVLPLVYIVITPTGNDRWMFDFRVTFEFTDPLNYHGKRHVFTSRTNGVVLTQDNTKYEGVYQGRPFPTVSPATAPPLTYRPVDHTLVRKLIPLPFLQRKFDEFINLRNGSLTDPNPPVRHVRLDNAGRFNEDTTPESFLDLQSLVAGKGTLNFVSNPSSLGQFTEGPLGFFTRDINSITLNLTVDAEGITPLRLNVVFETGGPQEIGAVDSPDIDIVRFAISLGLTLDRALTIDHSGHEITVVDLFSWVDELPAIKVTVEVDPSDGQQKNHFTGTWLHRPLDLWTLADSDTVLNLLLSEVLRVDLATSSSLDPGDLIHDKILSSLRGKLTDPDVLTKKTARDAVNSQVTTWLLGGVADDEHNTDQNNTVIHDIGIENANPELGIPEDSLVISYSGSQNAFVPVAPPGWPTATAPDAAFDFSPGTLANIDHIVVLTMENRSFDHMLGYLSLPRDHDGGEGRTDVDGLTGSESNTYRGTTFPIFALKETIFAPDPPHGYEPVHKAINGGAMDGFVSSFAAERGDRNARQIMGYQTAATVPVHDALARDFAIGHRWFASHPGPTFGNRFYELTGHLNLDPRGFWEFDDSPIRPAFTPTIFDFLSGLDAISGQKLTWAYFEHNYCFLRFFEAHTFDESRVITVDDLENGFFALASAGRLPSVSFIDPHFIELPPGANADGPPADIASGQDLVGRVVDAVVSGPAWDKTLLLIVYDEHGGFYDHVAPPPAVPVSADLAVHTLGLRVPAFVVSPWVRPGSVFGHDASPASHGKALHFDHTSILKTIARRFLSAAPPYLGARYAAASDLSAVLGNQPHRPQFRPFIKHNLRFTASQLMLEVKLGSPAPGTILWQSAANGTAAQDFSFEDADEGYVYIRSKVSNLYLTVLEPADRGPLTVVQDVKFRPCTSGAAKTEHRTALQRWKVTPAGISEFTRHDHVISSEAHPHLHLRPGQPDQPQSPIVLGQPSDGGPGNQPDVWRITSPLLPQD